MDLDRDQAVTIILGAHNYYDNGEEGRVRVISRKFWIHENFTMPSAENDLGIIELPEAINFTDSIHSIRISTRENIENGKEIIAGLSGWGYRKGEYQASEMLQTSRLKLIPHEDCIKFQGYYVETLTKNHICAIGHNNQPGKAVMPCDGDSR